MEKLRPKVTLQEVVELTQTSSSEVSELNCWLSGTSPLGRAPEASCPAEGRARQPGWAAGLQELTRRALYHLRAAGASVSSGSLWVPVLMAGLSGYPHGAPEDASIHGTLRAYHRAGSPGR